MRRLYLLSLIAALLFQANLIAPAWGQGYGTDSHNVLTPAAGGMAGVSLARPQDVPAAVFGNPSTLSQFKGVNFTLGGSWIEPTVVVNHNGFLSGGNAFRAKSGTQGFVGSEIAMTQDLCSLGIPGSLGFGVAGLSGLGAEFRGRTPIGGNVTGEMIILGVNMGAGVDITDRLAAGATITLGTGFTDLALVQASAMVHGYGLRATFGFDYDISKSTTVAAFYQTRLGLRYPNMFRLPGDNFMDVSIEQPDNFGFGIANNSLFDGDLLIAADVLYKNWEGADFYRNVFKNQWAFAFGMQLTRGRMKYRLGYSYNDNPLSHNVQGLGPLPVGKAAIEYLQATQLATINRHRITGGVGFQDFLFKGVDLDIFAGGLFRETDHFGPHTTSSVAAYYMGMGLTWHFDRCAQRSTVQRPCM